MKRASEVPPVVDKSGFFPVTFVIEFEMIFINSPFLAKNGSPVNSQVREYFL